MTRILLIISLAAGALAAAAPPAAAAQDAQEAGPQAALTSALVAACRQNEAPFAGYLTAENQSAFLQLPAGHRQELMRRMVLLAVPGRPSLSNDAEGRSVLLCEADGAAVTLRIGPARVRESLAFVALLAEERAVEIGMVREGGGWRILSVGLLLLNIPELARQWEANEIEAREAAAVGMLRRLRDAIKTYREVFGRLPEDLKQLGPASGEGVSPAAAQLVDAEVAAGRWGGYAFRYRILPAPPEGGEPGFELAAAPLEYGRGGRRSFYLDAGGVLRGADKQGAVATSADPRLEPDGRNP